MISALRRTLRIFGESRRTTLWTLLVLVCASVAIAIGGVAARSLEASSAQAPVAKAAMVVYLADATPDDVSRGLVDRLAKLPGVERAELVSSQETGERLARELDESLHADLAATGLPVSIEVTLAPGVTDVIAMSPAIRDLKTAPGVEDVTIVEPPAATATTSLHGIAMLIAALFGGLALITVLATVRVRLERGRQERAVAELLGAEPSFFAIPTALAGALQATLAALVGGGIVYLGITIWGDDIAALLGDPVGRAAITMPAASDIAMFVGAIGILGLVGGALAGIAGSSRPLRGVARA